MCGAAEKRRPDHHWLNRKLRKSRQQFCPCTCSRAADPARSGPRHIQVARGEVQALSSRSNNNSSTGKCAEGSLRCPSGDSGSRADNGRSAREFDGSSGAGVPADRPVGSGRAGSSAAQGSADWAGAGRAEWLAGRGSADWADGAGSAEPAGCSAARGLAGFCSRTAGSDHGLSGFVVGPFGLRDGGRSAAAAPMLRRELAKRSRRRHKENASSPLSRPLGTTITRSGRRIVPLPFRDSRVQDECSTSPEISTQSCLRSSQTEKPGRAK